MEYLTLLEKEAGQRTVYEAAPVTRAAMRAVFERMAALIAAGEKSVVRALEVAGDNTDEGCRFVCRYDLRTACSEKLAVASGKLKASGTARTPATVVAAAIERLNPSTVSVAA